MVQDAHEQVVLADEAFRFAGDCDRARLNRPRWSSRALSPAPLVRDQARAATRERRETTHTPSKEIGINGFGEDVDGAEAVSVRRVGGVQLARVHRQDRGSRRDPRWTPQIRPWMDRSKPATRRASETGDFYPAATS